MKNFVMLAMVCLLCSCTLHMGTVNDGVFSCSSPKFAMDVPNGFEWAEMRNYKLVHKPKNVKGPAVFFANTENPDEFILVVKMQSEEDFYKDADKSPYLLLDKFIPVNSQFFRSFICVMPADKDLDALIKQAAAMSEKERREYAKASMGEFLETCSVLRMISYQNGKDKFSVWHVKKTEKCTRSDEWAKDFEEYSDELLNLR